MGIRGIGVPKGVGVWGTIKGHQGCQRCIGGLVGTRYSGAEMGIGSIRSIGVPNGVGVLGTNRGHQGL